MSSLIGIINRSITDLGQTAIKSLDEGSETSDLARDYHIQALDVLLRRWDWNFARTRDTPSKAGIEDQPTFRYSSAFLLPNDPPLIKLLDVFAGEVPLPRGEYTLENNLILVNADPINITYTARILDPNKFEAGFEECYQNKLSAMLAIPLTGDRNLRQEAENLYRDSVLVAIAHNEDERGGMKTIYNGITSAVESLHHIDPRVDDL